MPNICYQLSKITFDVIYETLHFRLTFPNEKCFIYIISPWIHDIDIRDDEHQYFISTLLTNSTFEYSDVDKISSIIQTMLLRIEGAENFQVIIVTSLYNEISMSKSDQKKNKIEAKFLKNLLDYGAEVYFHPDLHAKMICTNGYSITGSANFTYPGLFKHTENVHLHYLNSEEYESDIKRAKNIIDEAKAIMSDKSEILKYIKQFL
ncbi:MAG: phospholipase D-like domain-containing protein [Candidatus Helarchaeota archaeon]